MLFGFMHYRECHCFLDDILKNFLEYFVLWLSMNASPRGVEGPMLCIPPGLARRPLPKPVIFLKVALLLYCLASGQRNKGCFM